ncbi:MAG: hypothetical protein U0326_03210 [Polyangiales bacterium]
MRSSTVLAFALMASLGCRSQFTTRGSPDAIRSVAVARSPDEVFGHTVRVTVPPMRIFGELISCDSDWLYLRVHEEVGNSAWQRIHWSENPTVDVELPSYGPGLLAWTLIGAVSTLSHGFYALITAPVWAIVGSIATTTGWNPRLGLESCRSARPYARFPQGMPASFSERFERLFDERTLSPVSGARAPTADGASGDATPAPPVEGAMPAPWDTPPSEAPAPPQPPAHEPGP